MMLYMDPKSIHVYLNRDKQCKMYCKLGILKSDDYFQLDSEYVNFSGLQRAYQSDNTGGIESKRR